MSYQGPATIIGDDYEIQADVQLYADTSSPIKSWEGTGSAHLPAPPPLLDQTTIRLPNGREAVARIDIYWSATPPSRLEIRGSGRPPFDV
jgi:hypothetical protein